ncbi:MAG: caspase family protein [Nitratireductor sp.]
MGGSVSGMRLRLLCAGLALLCALFTLPAVAAAQNDARALRGVALVIGNSDYAHLPRLANPENDADAIEGLLADLGFESVRRTDRDAKSLARDLDRFVEDAAEADVAVFYYAGHGIEAGGENFLVPVDADLSALGAASERLVPLNDILARLRESVAVTILLLDACRDNPFPPGATLKRTAGAQPVPLSAGGLAETRGARALADTPAGTTTGPLGMVLGFAAEPGRPALDGAGDNSPYAAALLRHVSAMAGTEFGTVMRMVAEEVYLKTDGRQLPWTNASLRRLLYFGEAPAPVEGPPGEILAERRRLLLTIADLPAVRRTQAETLARGGEVPMSVVFAMMQALGVDATGDPAAVEARLRAEIERFAENRRANAALANPDPEIERLSRLADEAELEGALETADRLREGAKQRVAALRSTRDRQIAALRDRIAEDAAVFARSAETKKLLFRHAEAADDYAEAGAILADWDDKKARDYRRAEIAARLTDAELKGSRSSLATAERLARETLGNGAGLPAGERARFARALARALMLRGANTGDDAAIHEALGVLETADAEALPAGERARLLLDTGRAGGQIALTAGDPAALADAGTKFAAAAALARQAGDRATEAEARFRHVQALYYRWAAAPSLMLFAALQGELGALVAMLDTDGDIDPVSARYAVRAPQIALDLAMRLNTTEALSTATEMNAMTAGLFDRERFPLLWAEIATTGGRIGLEWADRFGDLSGLSAALEAHEAALAIFRQARARAAALDAAWQRALTLVAIGLREDGTRHLAAALDALDAVESDPLAGSNPRQLRLVRLQKARVRAGIGQRRGDAAMLREGVAGLRTAHEGFDPAAEPQLATFAQAELGKAVRALAALADDAEGLRQGVDLLQTAIGQYEAWQAPATNPVPFVELFAHYADAAARLALATGSPGDIDRAVAAGTRINRHMQDVDNQQGIALTANTLAFVIVQGLRADFDAERLALAEEMAATVLARAPALPAFAGYFENTACEVRTEKARHDADPAAARQALALCESGLAKLRSLGDAEAAATAQKAVARAKALVATLAAR